MQGDEEKHAKLEAEVEQLTWKLRKMEESRRVYEDATSQLGSFLELVSSQLTVSGRWVVGLKHPHQLLIFFQISAGQHITSSRRRRWRREPLPHGGEKPACSGEAAEAS